MKSFAASEVVGHQRLVIPSGRVMPRAPQQGEIFNLEIDFPQTFDPLLPWYPRGAYVFSGTGWIRLSDHPRDRKAGIISAQEVENANAPKMGTMPTSRTGHLLSEVTVVPTFPRASFSGNATMWVDARTNGNIWLAAFRCDGPCPLVGLTSTYVIAGQPMNLSLTFYDRPIDLKKVMYSLRIYSDIKDAFLVNRGFRYAFDGASQTAFIVEENTNPP